MLTVGALRTIRNKNGYTGTIVVLSEILKITKI
jgi:hypothetical protein